MSIKPSDILPDPRGLPSLEEIHRYIDGKMIRDEQYQFEKQMEASELLAHAVKGLAMERTKSQANIDEINAFIDQKTGKEAKVISMFNYGNITIAASILVLLSGGILFLFFNRDDKSDGQVAMQSPTTPSLQNSDAAPAASQAESATKMPKEDKKEAIALGNAEEDLASVTKPRTKRRNRKNIAAEPLATDDLTFGSAYAASAAQESELAEMPEALDTVNYDLLAINMMSTELMTEELAKDKMDKAFEPSDAKQANQYEAAKPTTLARSSASPGASSDKRKKSESAQEKAAPIQSVYKWDESIIVFIKAGKTNLALMELNLIIDANDHRKEPAIWLKVACLIVMKRKKDAKEMLQILSESSSTYKEKATDILKDLR
jgi:hypothetical protein